MLIRYGQSDDAAAQTAAVTAQTAAIVAQTASAEGSERRRVEQQGLEIDTWPLIKASVISGLTVWFLTRWLGGRK